MAVDQMDNRTVTGQGVPTGTVAQRERQVAAARAAFASGRTRPLSWRLAQLHAMQRLLMQRAPQIRAAVHTDLGRNDVESQLTEIDMVRLEAWFASRHLKQWMRPRRVGAPLTVGTARARIQREPLGTVLIIGPWNYPVHLMLMPLVGALAAGNTVVLKPSELAPACSQLLAELVPQYIDAEAIQVVEGGAEATTQLLTHPFDHIFYTGNATVGSVVMTAAAATLSPVTLELGGKSPVWVDHSAPLEATARSIAWGKFSNCGQTCVAPDHVLTTPDLVEPLARAVARAVREMYGTDPRQSGDYGRIINQRHTQRIAGLLRSGRAVIGGDADIEHRYVAPTVLVDVDADAPVMQEEIFGPVLPIVAVDGLDEAIAFINARPKPLALYGFTANESTQQALLERTFSGALGLNVVMNQMAVSTLPFGGVGASGMGRYHGEFGMQTFSHERAVLQKLRGPDPLALARPPYSWLTRKLFVRG